MEQWLAKLRDGDRQTAWDLFSEQYRRLILATIRRLVTEPDDVMDVFAAVCHALIQNDYARLRRYSENAVRPASVATWLVAVVRNQTIDWLRSRDGRRATTADPDAGWQTQNRQLPEVAPPSSDPAETNESIVKLGAVLAQHPPDVQLAIQLFVVERMPAADVARAVGWPNAKTVYNRVRRALGALRAELQRQGIGPGDL